MNFTKYIESIELRNRALLCPKCGAELPEVPIKTIDWEERIGDEIIATGFWDYYRCENGHLVKSDRCGNLTTD